MLTNEDINMIKALIYASRHVQDSNLDAAKFNLLMDNWIKEYLSHTRPTQYYQN